MTRPIGIVFIAFLFLAGCAASLDDNASERCDAEGLCSVGRVCDRGFCVQQPGPDAAVDEGTAVPIDGGPVYPPCGRGQTRCGASCVSLETDYSHCGSCEISCSGDDECKHRRCEDN